MRSVLRVYNIQQYPMSRLNFTFPSKRWVEVVTHSEADRLQISASVYLKVIDVTDTPEEEREPIEKMVDPRNYVKATTVEQVAVEPGSVDDPTTAEQHVESAEPPQFIVEPGSVDDPSTSEQLGGGTGHADREPQTSPEPDVAHLLDDEARVVRKVEEVEDVEVPDRGSLSKETAAQLQKRIADIGLSAAPRATKAQLIELLLARYVDNADAPQTPGGSTVNTTGQDLSSSSVIVDGDTGETSVGQ